MYPWGEGLDAVSCSVQSAERWEGFSCRPKVLHVLRQEADGNGKRCPASGTDRREVREHSDAAKRRDARTCICSKSRGDKSPTADTFGAVFSQKLRNDRTCE